jgi:hypothetical protein
MSPTRTETLAVEALYGTGEDTPGLLNRLLTLTSGEPTTEELKEALGLISLEIPAVLKAWISSRNIIAAHARQAAEFREGHPHVAAAMDRLTPGNAALRQIAADVCSPELDAALDEWEERQNRIHPTFALLLAPFQRFA